MEPAAANTEAVPKWGEGTLVRLAEAHSGQFLLVLLAIHSVLLGYSAYVHSPTLNEPGHLAAGISHWQFGCFGLDQVNPPLARIVAALPVLATGAKTNWENVCEGPGVRSEAAVGFDFSAANGERSFLLFTMARWACMPFSWLGAAVCYLWGRDLYGASAGLLACALWCFCPNILAHASLVTSDVPAAALAVTACYVLWLWLREATWAGTVLAGVVLGLAELTKTTLIILYPLWLLLWISWRLADRPATCPRRWLREGVMFLVVTAISVYVVNLGYGFEGSCQKLGGFQFVSPTFTGRELGYIGNRFADSWLSALPVPFPKDYVLGIDLQRQDFESGRPSYLCGEFRRTGGWWFYYLYALAIKVPLGVWGLLLLTIILKLLGWLRKALCRQEAILLAPPLTILVFVSSQTGFSEHMRYILLSYSFG